ncbi:MAG: hypothetical protein ACRD09_16480 [Vicinamibacterales bacterium]
MRTTLRTLVCLLLFGAAAVDLTATTARRLSNADLAETADIIVIGRCTDVRAVWENPRTLVTVGTVAVTERLKGDAGDTIPVALPGGIDTNRRIPIGVTYAGAPQMRDGEDVFLFLSRDEAIASGFTVIGFSQGKFSIVADGKGGKAVSRDLTQITLVGPAGTSRGAAAFIALADFKGEILRYLGR